MCRSTSSMVAIVVVLLRAGTVLLRDDVSSGIDNDASSFGASFVERRRTSDWPPSVRGDPSTFVACFAGLAATESPAKAQRHRYNQHADAADSKAGGKAASAFVQRPRRMFRRTD